MGARIPFFRSAEQVRASADARQDYDRRRAAESDTRRLYRTSRWQAIARHILALQPLCQQCEREGRVTPAIVCDHITPHRGDVAAFWAGPFQSLCTHCHSSVKQAEEAAQAAAPPGGRKSRPLGG